MSEIDFLSPGIQQIRHSIRDIDDSYNHNWDVIAELCQNAVDAIRMSSVQRGVISLEVDCSEKSIRIADNGVGIEPNLLPTLLTVDRIQTSPLSTPGASVLPHATHTLLLSGFIQPVYVIDLKLVLAS